MTREFDENDIDVRSPRYLIARSSGHCEHCGHPTVLVAVCLPPGHESFDEDDVWSRADRHVFLFHIDNLCEAAQRRLREIAPYYDFDPGEEGGSQWVNHCEHCGALLDDVGLFCEPEGPFLPTSEVSARRIRLVAVEEPIEARAAGLADEPEFFDCMSRE
jgi:hypothetical protein